MTATEWLGALTGLLCVFLTVRASAWNWPVGILNNVFFFLLFFDAGLFADALLQVVYVGVSLYGWWLWLRGGSGGGERAIGRVSREEAVLVAGITLASTAGMGALLDRLTPSTVPWMDAWTTALSLAAVWLQSRKYLESWYLWIAADVFYIGLYLQKELQLTAGVYAVFLLMCLFGLRAWKEKVAVQEATCLAS